MWGRKRGTCAAQIRREVEASRKKTPHSHDLSHCQTVEPWTVKLQVRAIDGVAGGSVGECARNFQVVTFMFSPKSLLSHCQTVEPWTVKLREDSKRLRKLHCSGEAKRFGGAASYRIDHRRATMYLQVRAIDGVAGGSVGECALSRPFSLPNGRTVDCKATRRFQASEKATLQWRSESIIAAPRCTFKYVQSTESPEEALASALATFKL
jgi:hypothetical protein